MLTLLNKCSIIEKGTKNQTLRKEIKINSKHSQKLILCVSAHQLLAILELGVKFTEKTTKTILKE